MSDYFMAFEIKGIKLSRLENDWRQRKVTKWCSNGAKYEALEDKTREENSEWCYVYRTTS